jgi:transcriptional regulator with XRE-family HTH domain
MLEEPMPNRLKEWRTRRVMTQKDLAEKSGVAETVISRIESGLQKPRPSTIRKLAEALGIKPEELLDPQMTSPGA